LWAEMTHNHPLSAFSNNRHLLFSTLSKHVVCSPFHPSYPGQGEYTSRTPSGHGEDGNATFQCQSQASRSGTDHCMSLFTSIGSLSISD
jgi:hypothetical protein